MATKRTAVTKAMDDKPDRFKMSETGYMGLNLFKGVSVDELRTELNFPNSIKTFKEMSVHGTVNSALTLYHNLLMKVDWKFVPPNDATPEEIEQCKLIASMMDDMETPWSEFISDALSCNMFGFSVHEKVYRRRNTNSGSKFNDNVIGWKKLPIRIQETIEKFIFSEDGNEVIGVKQNIKSVNDLYNRFEHRLNKEVILPKSKILLFRVGKHRGDPFGKSPLRDAYLAWRYLTIIEEIESNGVAKDLVGLPVLSIPPQYLSEDASPDQKAINY